MPGCHEAKGPVLRLMLVACFMIAFDGSLPSPASATTVAGTEAARDRRPSVLLILPDQWRGQDLGCMGNPEVRTPNLDRLAAPGGLFPHTFPQTPGLSPARG